MVGLKQIEPSKEKSLIIKGFVCYQLNKGLVLGLKKTSPKQVLKSFRHQKTLIK